MKIKTGKNDLGLTIKFPHGPEYLVRYENIPNEWIHEKIASTIEFYQSKTELEYRKQITVKEARTEVIERIKKEEERHLEDYNLFCGLGWDEFTKELTNGSEFDLSEIWDDPKSWE